MWKKLFGPTPAFGAAGLVFNGAAAFWFAITMIGQWLFFYFIVAFYGFSVISGNPEIWNRWEPLGSTPFVAGDTGGNLTFAAHVLGAGVVAFGGALQLIPGVRARFPRFHRVNGYLYLLTVFCLALSGFYLVLVRGTSPNAMSAVGTLINGTLILVFMTLALLRIRQRDIRAHRRWALRLFLVSNAQWFLRVGVFSYMITGTALGLEPGFGDPFFTLWTFGCYLLPLAVLQLYFYAAERGGQPMLYATSGVIVLLGVLLAVGILGFTPFLQSLITGGTIKL